MDWTSNHPQIDHLFQLYEQEQQPFRKIHRMIDLFEVIIKTHTAAIIGSYFHINSLSDQVKAILAEGLKTPSLGTWQLFSRVIVYECIIKSSLTSLEYDRMVHLLDRQQKETFSKYYEMAEEGYILRKELVSGNAQQLIKYFKKANYLFSPKLLHPQFYSYFLDWDVTVQKVITLRNHYAHGATPTDEVCRQDAKLFEPILLSMKSAVWLQETKISMEHGFMPHVIDAYGQSINLFPILSFHEEMMDPQLVFLNDLKKLSKKKITLLHYPTAKHVYDEELYPYFIDRIKIHEWKYKEMGEFKDRIDELIETFRGREKQMEEILAFIQKKDKGFLFIKGLPGIGKSAMVAKVIDRLKKNKNSDVPRYHVLEYFIRRGTHHASSSYFLLYLQEILEELVATNLPIPYGQNQDVLFQTLLKRMRIISGKLDRKLILFVDGLDEACEETNDFMQYIMMTALPQILFIYSSRDVKRVKDLYFHIPLEHREEIRISGLDQKDIRALLYGVTDKYEISSAYVEAIAEKSQGNPLYLKMLCLALENHELQLNDSSSLPKKVEEFYQSILQKFHDGAHSDEIIAGLFVVAAMKDYASKAHLQHILFTPTSVTMHIVNALSEIWIENPKNERQFQLFHESLREYLVEAERDGIRHAHLQIAAFCRQWKEWIKKLDPEVAAYPFRFYSQHLVELGWRDELYLLARQDEYANQQILHTQQYDASLQLYKDGILMAMRHGHFDVLMEMVQKVYQLYVLVKQGYKDIFTWCAAGNEMKLKMALERAKLSQGSEQVVLYFYIMLSTLLDPNEKTRKNHLEMTLLEWDKHLPKEMDVEKIISHDLLVWVIERLRVLELDPAPVLTRRGERESDTGSDELKATKALAFAEQKDWKQSLEIVDRDCKDNVIRAKTMMRIACLMYQDGWKEDALSIMEKSLLTGRHAHKEYNRYYAIELAIMEANSFGLLSVAMDVLASIEEEYPKAMGYSAASTAAFLHGDREICQRYGEQAIFYAQHVKTNKSASLIGRKSFTFSRLLIEFAKQGKHDLVDTWWEEVRHEHHKYWMISRIAIQHVSCNELDQALVLLDLMKEGWQKDDVYLELIRHGLLTHQVGQAKQYLFQLHLRSSFDQGFQLISDHFIRNDEASQVLAFIPDYFGYQSIKEDKEFIELSQCFSFLSNENYLQGNLDQADRFREIGHKILQKIRNRALRASAVEYFALELAKHNRLAEMTEMISEAIFLEEKGNLRKYVALDLAKQGQLDEAIQLLDLITYPYQEVDILSSLSNIMFEKGLLEKSSGLLEQAIQKALDIPEAHVRNQVFGQAVGELCRTGRVDEASSFVSHMTDQKIRSIAQRTIAYHRFILNLDSGFEGMSHVEDPEERLIGYVKLYQWCLDRQQNHTADMCMAEIKQGFLSLPEGQAFDDLYAEWALCHARYRSMEEAIRCITQIGQEDRALQTLLDMAFEKRASLKAMKEFISSVQASKLDSGLLMEFWLAFSKKWFWFHPIFEELAFLLVPIMVNHKEMLHHFLLQYEIHGQWVSGKLDGALGLVSDYIEPSDQGASPIRYHYDNRQEWMNGIQDEDCLQEMELNIRKYEKGRINLEELNKKIMDILEEYSM